MIGFHWTRWAPRLRRKRGTSGPTPPVRHSFSSVLGHAGKTGRDGDFAMNGEVATTRAVVANRTPSQRHSGSRSAGISSGTRSEKCACAPVSLARLRRKPRPPGGRERGFRRLECHIAVHPPSTAIAWPVMNDALSEARKSTVWAISEGCAIRRRGGMTPAISRGSMRAIMPVSVSPGHIALIRIPASAFSRAADRVRPTTACLTALYTALRGVPTSPRPRRRC